MAKNITQYSIFLGSPSDLEDERIEVENVIKELNLGYSKQNNLTLELIKWETHSAPAISNSYTQDIINNDVGSDYDIFIGLIWKKFGTKTEIANSGTEEEFLNAIRRFNNKENIQILFYFKTSTPKSINDLDPQELIKINNFKDKLKENNVLYDSFNEMEEFKAKLRLHLPKRINNLLELESVNQKDNSKPSIPIHENETEIIEEDLGLLDYLFGFENLFSNSSQALTNISISSQNVGDELTKKAEEFTRLTQSPNPNRNLMIQLFKRVSKILDDYSYRISIETPSFYDNFKEGINYGLKYMNVMSEFDEEDYIENLNLTLDSSLELKAAIPNAIEGMTSMHDAVKSLPKIQSDLNAAKRKLDSQLEDLVNKLRSSYKLVSEFISEIEIRLHK